MKRNIKFVFRSAAQGDVPKTPGLTVVIRTDARHATASLKEHLVDELAGGDDLDVDLKPRRSVPAVEAQVEKTLHMAYQEWGHSVLGALADCLDYDRYGLTQPEDKIVNVHFYNAHDLSIGVHAKADQLVRQAGLDQSGAPTVYISLDDLIEEHRDNWHEIGFSRLFNLHGDQQGDYMARPGTPPLEDQMKRLCQHLKELKAKYGAPVPIVFLEDNVRHAKMLNWVIDKMEQENIFEYGQLAGIATCFCCATADERAKIQCQGRKVPIGAVVDYGDAKVDVATPRDLLFDGFVVQVADHTARLPAVFMDIEKLFKIQPEKKEEFRELVTEANVAFCERLEQEFGIRIPLGWFSVADAVSKVAGVDPATPMIEVLKKPANQNIPPPDTGLNFG
ncbi:MAG TPA: hypothetical protein VL625_03710 [Patescibacteria group bacterium]|jgi:hypothetical protein|nr:hypothetical protein [Patescibacteria group bacterium]